MQITRTKQQQICSIVSSVNKRSLLQAFVGNASSCDKVQDRHIHKVLDNVCKFKDQVPEYLDVLYSMVRLVGVDTPLRRNQAAVMKHLMRSFKHVGADFSSERDVRCSTQTNSSTHKHTHTPQLTDCNNRLNAFNGEQLTKPTRLYKLCE